MMKMNERLEDLIERAGKLSRDRLDKAHLWDSECEKVLESISDKVKNDFKYAGEIGITTSAEEDLKNWWNNIPAKVNVLKVTLKTLDLPKRKNESKETTQGLELGGQVGPFVAKIHRSTKREEDSG